MCALGVGVRCRRPRGATQQGKGGGSSALVEEHARRAGGARCAVRCGGREWSRERRQMRRHRPADQPRRSHRSEREEHRSLCHFRCVLCDTSWNYDSQSSKVQSICTVTYIDETRDWYTLLDCHPTRSRSTHAVSGAAREQLEYLLVLLEYGLHLGLQAAYPPIEHVELHVYGAAIACTAWLLRRLHRW